MRESKKEFEMNRFFSKTIFVISSLFLAASVCASADVGLINQMRGDVTFQSGTSPAKASAYMKVREGDRFVVPDGATVRIVYFDGGRQETWTGPASFRAGTRQGEGAQGKVDVSQVPGGAATRLEQTATVIQVAKLGRAGGVTVRAVKPQLTAAAQSEVAQARRTYDQWKSRVASDDITPELYLYLVLNDYMLYEEMGPVIKTMQDKQPNSAEVKDLAAWVSSRTQN
jgi:hypothetical protein